MDVERYVGGFKKTIGTADEVKQIDGYLVFSTKGTCGYCRAEDRSVRWFKGMLGCPACIIDDLAVGLDDKQRGELREMAVDILSSHS